MGDITSRLEKSSDSGRRLKIGVLPSLIAKKEEELLKRYSKEISIDGFRKGRVPISIIEKRFGPTLKGEALEDTCRDAYLSVIKEKGIVPLTRAEIDNIKQDKKQLSFTASFEVIPELDIDYKDIVIKVPFRQINDEDVDGTIDNMRFSYATYIPVVRVSAPGDYLVIDYDYMRELKRVLLPGEVTKFGFILGCDDILEEFNKNLVNRRPGDSIKIKIRYPIGFSDVSIAGRDVSYNIRVNEVKEVKLPSVDDEFAKVCGFKDLKELKENVKDNLIERLNNQVKELLPGLVLNELAEKHEFEPPKVFVNIALDSLKDDIKNNKIEPIDDKEISQRARWNAKVRAILIIIADNENIAVTDEELKDLLKDSLKPPEIRTIFKDSDRREYLRAYFRRGKVVNKLVEEALVKYTEKTDKSGDLETKGSFDKKDEPKPRIITNI